MRQDTTPSIKVMVIDMIIGTDIIIMMRKVLTRMTIPIPIPMTMTMTMTMTMITNINLWSS